MLRSGKMLISEIDKETLIEILKYFGFILKCDYYQQGYFGDNDQYLKLFSVVEFVNIIIKVNILLNDSNIKSKINLIYKKSVY